MPSLVATSTPASGQAGTTSSSCSLWRSDRETDPGYAPFDFEVICHITEFVRVLEARLGFICAGRPTSPPRLRKFGGDQEVKVNSWLGRYMPHRIWREPPSKIRIQL